MPSISVAESSGAASEVRSQPRLQSMPLTHLASVSPRALLTHSGSSSLSRPARSWPTLAHQACLTRRRALLSHGAALRAGVGRLLLPHARQLRVPQPVRARRGQALAERPRPARQRAADGERVAPAEPGGARLVSGAPTASGSPPPSQECRTKKFVLRSPSQLSSPCWACSSRAPG